MNFIPLEGFVGVWLADDNDVWTKFYEIGCMLEHAMCINNNLQLEKNPNLPRTLLSISQR